MPTQQVLTGPSVTNKRDFGVKQIQFKDTDSCAPTKRHDILENMNNYDAKGGYLGSAEVTHIYRRRLHECKRKGLPHVERDLQRYLHDCRWSLRLMENYPSGEPSRPMVHLLMIPEDSMRTISD